MIYGPELGRSAIAKESNESEDEVDDDDDDDDETEERRWGLENTWKKKQKKE